jgi:hypothetical protein
MRSLGKVLCRITTAVLFLLLPLGSWAQSPDPLVGAWNLTGTQNGSPIIIAVMTFHAGGTTTEFDTSGTNSSASPGESIDLGVWSKTANRSYTFKEQNYIYDSTGNLSELAVGVCNLTLASGLNSFKGSCSVNFYNCSLTECPGSLVTGPVTYQISAKRF